MDKQQLKPSDAKLLQLSARSIVVDPILDDQGKVDDVQLRIAPMYRGGDDVGKYVIDNPTDSRKNPSQFSQHYVPLKWETFQKICRFNPHHNSLTPWQSMSKPKLIQHLQSLRDKGHALKLQYTANGALNRQSKYLQILSDHDGFDFDAQVDMYTDLTKMKHNRYQAIRWSNIASPVSTQYPDWSQMQQLNLQKLMTNDVQVVPQQIDNTGQPHDFKIRFRPTFRDNSADHQAKTNLLQDWPTNSRFNYYTYDGQSMGKHGYYQEISLQDFNHILKMTNHKPISNNQLQQLNFKVKPSKDHFSPHPDVLPAKLPLDKPLFFDAWAPMFEFDDKKQQHHAFRYVEPSVVMPAGSSDLLVKQAKTKANHGSVQKAQINPKLKLMDSQTSQQTLHKLADKGTSPDENPQVDSNGKPLTVHQTMTKSLGDLLKATQIQVTFKQNQAKTGQSSKSLQTKQKNDHSLQR